MRNIEIFNKKAATLEGKLQITRQTEISIEEKFNQNMK